MARLLEIAVAFLAATASAREAALSERLLEPCLALCESPTSATVFTCSNATSPTDAIVRDVCAA